MKIKYLEEINFINFIWFVDEINNVHWIKGYKFISYAHKNGFNKLQYIQFLIQKNMVCNGASYMQILKKNIIQIIKSNLLK